MADVRPVLTREQELERSVVTRGLRFGVILSAALLLSGTVTWVAAGQPVLKPFHAWGSGSQLTWAHASGFLLSAGVLGLVFTPILRVLLLVSVYLRLRDFTFFTVSLAVLALLGISAVLGAL